MFFKDDDFWKPVITTRQVIEGSDSVACVTLDEEGDWQVFGFEDFTDDDLDTVSVEEMLQIAPSLAFLPDMAPGESVTRGSKEEPWEKEEEE